MADEVDQAGCVVDLISDRAGDAGLGVGEVVQRPDAPPLWEVGVRFAGECGELNGLVLCERVSAGHHESDGVAGEVGQFDAREFAGGGGDEREVELPVAHLLCHLA